MIKARRNSSQTGEADTINPAAAGLWVRTVWQRLEMSAGEFSQRIGVPKQSALLYAAGMAKPSYTVVCKIKEYVTGEVKLVLQRYDQDKPALNENGACELRMLLGKIQANEKIVAAARGAELNAGNAIEVYEGTIYLVNALLDYRLFLLRRIKGSQGKKKAACHA